jgi:hypothetical protein
LELPIAFPGGGSGSGGFDSVGGGATGMTGDVRGGGGMTGSTGGCSGRGIIGEAGGGLGGQGGGARRPAPYLPARPGACGFQGLARPLILRVLVLEAREHVLGAIGGPERQGSLVALGHFTSVRQNFSMRSRPFSMLAMLVA